MGHWGAYKILNLNRVVLSFVRSQPLQSAILQVSAKVWCLLRLLCCCLIAIRRNLRHSAFATQSCLLRRSWGFRPRPVRPQMHPIDHAMRYWYMSWGKKQAPAPEALALQKLHIRRNRWEFAAAIKHKKSSKHLSPTPERFAIFLIHPSAETNCYKCVEEKGWPTLPITKTKYKK